MILFCAILLTIGIANAVVTVPLVHRRKTLQEFRTASAKRASRWASGEGSKEAQESSVPMRDNYDSDYFGEIFVGTPPQKFILIFESGTANLWVPKVGCDAYGFGSGNFYDNSLSSTWQALPKLGNFANLAVNGTYAKDTVIMGGLTIDNQEFVEATWKRKEFFEEVTFDGIMGMGLAGAAIGGVNPPMYNLAAQGKIKHNMFGLYLDSGEGNASLLTIGGTEKSLYTEDLFYAPLSLFQILQPHWLVAGNDFKVGHRSANVCGGNGCQFMLDNAAQTIAFGTALSQQRKKHLMKMFGFTEAQDLGMYFFLYNCSNADSMPMLTFTINGKNFDLGPEFYIVRLIVDDTGDIACMASIEFYFASYAGLSNVISLGAPFVRKYYSVFDADRGRVGLALAKQSVTLQKPLPPYKHPSLQTDTQTLFM